MSIFIDNEKIWERNHFEKIQTVLSSDSWTHIRDKIHPASFIEQFQQLNIFCDYE